MAKTDTSYSTYTIVCAIILVICIIAVIAIQAKAKKLVVANIDDVEACIAKKIYGNDNTQVYYGIYTVGANRHDPEFIENVAYKIFNIGIEPDEKIRRTIESMFAPKLEGMNATPVLLPVEFTYGEEVYKKEFDFKPVDNQMKLFIQENEDKFIALSFNNRSVMVLKSIS